MPYLVFDCRKASGFLFETRHKWLAHGFCVIASWLGSTQWDYDAAMDFTPWDGYTSEDDRLDRLAWEETYHGAQ